QTLVDVAYVFHAFVLEPLPECRSALLAVDGDSILPRRPAAEDAREFRACLGGKLQSFREFGIADAGGQIDEGFRRYLRRAPKMFHRLLLRVRLLSTRDLRALDVLHIDRHFDF